MLVVPLTRGSTRKLRPVISPTAFTTASMSALTKFSVTVSASCASAAGASSTHVQNSAEATIPRRRNSAREQASASADTAQRGAGRTNLITGKDAAPTDGGLSAEPDADVR